METAHHPVLEP